MGYTSSSEILSSVHIYIHFSEHHSPNKMTLCASFKKFGKFIIFMSVIFEKQVMMMFCGHYSQTIGGTQRNPTDN